MVHACFGDAGSCMGSVIAQLHCLPLPSPFDGRRFNAMCRRAQVQRGARARSQPGETGWEDRIDMSLWHASAAATSRSSEPASLGCACRPKPTSTGAVWWGCGRRWRAPQVGSWAAHIGSSWGVRLVWSGVGCSYLSRGCCCCCFRQQGTLQGVGAGSLIPAADGPALWLIMLTLPPRTLLLRQHRGGRAPLQPRRRQV